MAVDAEIREQSPDDEGERGMLFSLVAKICKWMSVLACVGLVVMTLVVTADMAGRDLFNWPLRGTSEIVGLLMLCAATWGLGQAQLEKSHLRVLLIYDYFPRRLQVALDLLAYLCCLVSSAVITWQVILRGIKSSSDLTQTLGLPFAPFVHMMAFGFGLMVLVLLADISKSIREVLKS